jgi:hypothetical protein
LTRERDSPDRRPSRTIPPKGGTDNGARLSLYEPEPKPASWRAQSTVGSGIAIARSPLVKGCHLQALSLFHGSLETGQVQKVALKVDGKEVSLLSLLPLDALMFVPEASGLRYVQRQMRKSVVVCPLAVRTDNGNTSLLAQAMILGGKILGFFHHKSSQSSTKETPWLLIDGLPVVPIEPLEQLNTSGCETTDLLPGANIPFSSKKDMASLNPRHQEREILPRFSAAHCH